MFRVISTPSAALVHPVSGGQSRNDEDEDEDCLGFRVISTPSATLVHPVSGGQFSKPKRSASLNYKQNEDEDGEENDVAHR